MTCITIYSPVLRAPQEGYNELQRVTMGYKPLWGKQPDHQHVSDFPRVADVPFVDPPTQRGFHMNTAPPRRCLLLISTDLFAVIFH